MSIIIEKTEDGPLANLERRDIRHITIKYQVLDDILVESHCIAFERKQTPERQAIACKKAILAASIDSE